ncbi:hypothetical protein GWI67_11240 [Proteus sp. G2672]|uniref:tail fiber domain-containing protein n=1 Tax=Proteus sp. G2672 TaxID=2698884 RepID=UPI0013776488|nr:tail fiber domain-containing protein [Proteus sp. G2672]NBL78136.1 hypothetical protein [Proteus sp. G2672]
MTVSTELSHEEYVGNGVTTDFDFRFRIFEGKHLIVVVADSDSNEKTLKNGTDYTIVGAGSYHGGKVVLNKPLAQGWKILLERDLPVVQETDLRNQGKFFAEVHEDAFDYLTMLIQKALGTFSLSLRKPTYLSNYYDAKGNRIANLAPPKLGTDAVNKDYVDNSIKDIDSKTLRVKDKPINALPNTEQRANKILAFDDNGQPITVLPESGSASDVLIELGKPIGASLVGTESGKTIQESINLSGVSNTFCKKEHVSVPIRNKYYDEIISIVGGDYGFPQGFDIDDDGNFWMNFPIGNKQKRPVIVFSKTGKMITWFTIPESSSQSIVVTGSVPNIKIYDRQFGDQGYLYEYDIGNFPAKGVNITTGTKTNALVSSSMFAVRNGVVITQSSKPYINNTGESSTIYTMDLASGKVIGVIRLSPMFVGFPTPRDDIPGWYQKLWKMQGLTLSNTGTILIAYGGSYKPYVEWLSQELDSVHDIGIAEISMQGELLRHSVCKAGKFLHKINGYGYSASRTENEGISISPDGKIISLNAISDPENETINYPKGLLFLEEFSPKSDGMDFSECRSSYAPFNRLSLSETGRNFNGRYYNPITGEPFTDLPDLIKYMIYFDVFEFQWCPRFEPQLIIDGVVSSSEGVCKLIQGDQYNFTLEYKSVSNIATYVINGSLDDGWKIKNEQSSRLIELKSTGQGRTSIKSSNSVTGDNKLSVIDVAIQPNTSVIRVGGSQDNDLSPSLIEFHTSLSENKKIPLAVESVTVRPGVDGETALGWSNKRWKDLYAVNGAIVTSDERKKCKISDLSDAEKRTAITIKSLIKKYKMKDSVAEKGSSARWHFGVIAQDIIDVFSKNGLDALDYGIICYDEWEEEGKLKNSYAVRYDELLCFIISAI